MFVQSIENSMINSLKTTLGARPGSTDSREGRAGATAPDTRKLCLLFAPAETHPTYRPDVSLLFGKFLPALDIRIDLVAVAGEPESESEWEGGSLRVRRYRSKLGFVWADIRQQLALFTLARRGYDGLVVRDKPLLGVIGLAAAKLAGIPFVYWMSFPIAETYFVIARNADGQAGLKRRIYAWLRGHLSSVALYRLLIPHAAHLFVQSPAMLAHVRTMGLRHERVSAVPMGVDSHAAATIASAAGTQAAADRSAVYLGSLERLRRRELEAMVDAARLVSEAYPGFVLLIIGEAETPSEEGWLKRYAEAQGAGHCTRFFGWVPQSQGLAIASTATLGVSPIPRDELFDMGSPTKAVEYLALGLPVVCNDQPDQAHVVHESGGGYAVEMTASAFAEAMMALLGDAEQARQMGQRGQAWVAEHRDYRRIAADVAQALRECCGRRVDAS